MEGKTMGNGVRIASIAKSWTFHAAHRLPNHSGLCRDLHGHSYKLEIKVTGQIREKDGTSSEGMVLDFGDLKLIYKDRIEPLVEHKYLNETLKHKVALTTAECMAQWIAEEFAHELFDKDTYTDFPQARRQSVFYVRARLWETPTSYAEYESYVPEVMR